MEPRHFTLAHLQNHLPWTLPYSYDFVRSQEVAGHRCTIHDVLHVIKSMGRLAALLEKDDHGIQGSHQDIRDFYSDTPDLVADLVICALHMANTSPAGPFDLEKVVVEKLEKRNGVTLPPMTE